MDLHEALYWQRAPGEWVNLEPYLPRLPVPGWPGLDGVAPDPSAVFPSVAYTGPQRAVPDLFDLLRASHPRARVAPPYRTVTILLAATPPIALYAEITAALDDGFFAGLVTRIERAVDSLTLEVTEAAYLLARTHVDPVTFQPVLAS